MFGKNKYVRTNGNILTCNKCVCKNFPYDIYSEIHCCAWHKIDLLEHTLK